MKNSKNNACEMVEATEAKQNKFENFTTEEFDNYVENFFEKCANEFGWVRHKYKSIEDTFFSDEKGVMLHNSKY